MAKLKKKSLLPLLLILLIPLYSFLIGALEAYTYSYFTLLLGYWSANIADTVGAITTTLASGLTAFFLTKNSRHKLLIIIISVIASIILARTLGIASASMVSLFIICPNQAHCLL